MVPYKLLTLSFESLHRLYDKARNNIMRKHPNLKRRLFMKKSVLLLIACLLLSMTACGGAENKPAANVKDIKKEEPKEKAPTETVSESEFGRLEVIAQNKEINDTYESGPMKLTVNALQISKLNPSDNYKEMFEGKDEVSVITMAVDVENTSEDTISFYPDQSTVVTDTKEQKEANIFISDELGGDFIGNVKKSGNIIYILDSKAEDIHSLKFVIEGASNSNLETVGDKIEFNYSL